MTLTLKLLAAVAIVAALGWAALPGLPACPLPDGPDPSRLAVLGDDRVLRIYSDAELVGSRPDVLQVEAGWFGWVVTQPGRLVRIDDAGFEVASTPAPQAQALGFGLGHAWVVAAGSLTAYNDALDPVGSIRYTGQATDMRFLGSTILLDHTAIDAETPAAMRLLDAAPEAPSWEGVGGRVVRVGDNGVQCSAEAGLPAVSLVRPTSDALLAAGGAEVVALRGDGPHALLRAPLAIVDFAAGAGAS